MYYRKRILADRNSINTSGSSFVGDKNSHHPLTNMSRTKILFRSPSCTKTKDGYICLVVQWHSWDTKQWLHALEKQFNLPKRFRLYETIAASTNNQKAEGLMFPEPRDQRKSFWNSTSHSNILRAEPRGDVTASWCDLWDSQPALWLVIKILSHYSHACVVWSAKRWCKQWLQAPQSQRCSNKDSELLRSNVGFNCLEEMLVGFVHEISNVQAQTGLRLYPTSLEPVLPGTFN